MGRGYLWGGGGGWIRRNWGDLGEKEVEENSFGRTYWVGFEKFCVPIENDCSVLLPPPPSAHQEERK